MAKNLFGRSNLRNLTCSRCYLQRNKNILSSDSSFSCESRALGFLSYEVWRWLVQKSTRKDNPVGTKIKTSKDYRCPRNNLIVRTLFSIGTRHTVCITQNKFTVIFLLLISYLVHLKTRESGAFARCAHALEYVLIQYALGCYRAFSKCHLGRLKALQCTIISSHLPGNRQWIANAQWPLHRRRDN